MKIKFTLNLAEAKPPYRKHDNDACYDLYVASVKETGDLVEYDSGVAFEIPDGYVGLLHPRSSVSETGLILSNCVGVIDSGYRGNVKGKFYRRSPLPIYEVGDRFCQIRIVPVIPVEFEKADSISDSTRGTGGFGSTGK